jgi:multicomponent Na+:H+ antiporter subunit D
VAPAPASAALSGVITKAGVLCVIRVLYEYVGADFLRGTWVQYALLALATLTVFMGSMMAFRQDLLKKRLAYSSVSQLSYVLCGLFFMNKVALAGGLLHVVGHALIKNGLFLCAGAIIYKTGKTKVDELKGLGQQMPVTFACMTFFSLGLIGIPPTVGFVSKWKLMQGAGQSNMPIFWWLVPLMLIVSAILTAAYLLPLCTRGFLGTPVDKKAGRINLSFTQSVPLIVLAGLVLLVGSYPLPLTRLFEQFSLLLMP